MSAAGNRVLISTLIVAGLSQTTANASADAPKYSQNGDSTFLSRVELLQKMLKEKSSQEGSVEVAQSRGPSWVDFSKWAQCGSDVKC